VISVIDYGAGNLRSVTNVLDAIGAAHRIAVHGDALDGATKLLLPGVGHFAQLATALDTLGLRAPLLAAVASGVPVLGICLGMQILFESSDEAPGSKGLGVLTGHVSRLDGADRLPHMGWNTVTPCVGSTLVPDADRFYFANSYACPVTGATAATVTYGTTFAAAVQAGPVSGVQFHPEKSGRAGVELVRRWAVA
jgi:imidazole glycerol phosphate synthase glutamine amidotransferase subunit